MPDQVWLDDLVLRVLRGRLHLVGGVGGGLLHVLRGARGLVLDGRGGVAHGRLRLLRRPATPTPWRSTRPPCRCRWPRPSAARPRCRRPRPRPPWSAAALATRTPRPKAMPPATSGLPCVPLADRVGGVPHAFADRRPPRSTQCRGPRAVDGFVGAAPITRSRMVSIDCRARFFRRSTMRPGLTRSPMASRVSPRCSRVSSISLLSSVVRSATARPP